MAFTHLQKPARRGNKTVEVDHQMVDLLEWCWEREISTDSSCQGDSQNLPYIMFSSAADAEKFLSSMTSLNRELAEQAEGALPRREGRSEVWQLEAACASSSPERITVSLLLPPRDLDLLRSAISS